VRHPLVSVLIPCYNAEKWVGEAIQSALDQTYPNTEVIVVDDGSSDGSLEVIKSFEDKIRWETGSNQGANAARNRLLELSRGEWLQYLDADDYLLPSKIERQVEFLRACPDADVVYAPCYVKQYDARGETAKELLLVPSADPWLGLLTWQLGCIHSTLFSRRALLAVGGWNPKMRSAQEHELYFRLLSAGLTLRLFGEPGAVYRSWRCGSVSTCDRGGHAIRRTRIITSGVDFLRHAGELTAERKCGAVTLLYRSAQSLWARGNDGWRTIVSEILRIDPHFAATLRSVWPRHGWLYTLFGFELTQRLSNAVGKLRRAICGSRLSGIRQQMTLEVVPPGGRRSQ
jgi:glycosyltransferase involved in cell wall biosynthesis